MRVTVNRLPAEVKDFVRSGLGAPRGVACPAMKRNLVVVVSLLALVAAGCSSGDSGGGSDGGAKATTTAAKATTSTTAAAPEPLDDQTPPTSINGIAVQGDTIWVASIKDDAILQVDRESGAILRRIDAMGAGPDDVAVAPDGTVWSTGFVNGDVGHIVDGSYEVVLKMKPGINPIAFAPDGTLYIGTYGPKGLLFALDTTQDPVEAVEIAGDMPDINAFGVIADGTIVSPAGGLTGPSAAVAIDPKTGDVTTIVDGLPAVAAGTTDAEGNAYVLANISGEVIQVDADAKTSEVVQTVEQGAPFDNLSFADDGTIYLSSFTAPTITEVQPDGTERLITIGS